MSVISNVEAAQDIRSYSDVACKLHKNCKRPTKMEPRVYTLLKLIFICDLWISGRAIPENCYEEFFSYSGSITSLDYPQPYPSGRTCTWIISTISEYKVQLAFETFDVENHTWCKYDHVTVFDGISDKVVGKFCGQQVPLPLISSKNVIRVVFVSDPAVQGLGFKATYQSVMCGENFNQSKGSFGSPNFPRNFVGFPRCIWTIETDKYTQVSLSLRHDVSNSSNCSSEYLEIYSLSNEDGSLSSNASHLSPSRSLLLTRICGNNVITPISNDIRSTSNKMYVVFVSESPIQGIKFQASFTAVPCGGHFEKDEGSFASINYPANYPNNVDCVWIIAVSEGYQIALQFKDFQLSYKLNCSGDYLEVRDGHNASSPLLLDPLCGTSVSDVILSSSNEMRVRFKSDAEINDIGFFATFTKDIDECTVDNSGCQHVCKNTIGNYICSCDKGSILKEDLHGCEKACGGDLETDEGNLTIAINFPSSTKTLDCVWTVTVSEGYQVSMEFMDFKTPITFDCMRAHLEIRDGLNDSSDIIQQTSCETTMPSFILSPSNIVHIYYKTETSLNNSRLFAKFEKDIDECSTNNGGCEHTCKNSVGSYMCTCPLGKILHENKHNCINVCSYNVRSTELEQEIKTPNYPNDYQNNSICHWILQTVPGHRIHLVFTEVNTQRTLDYISIFDGESKDPIGVLSGNLKPADPIISLGNSLKIIFKSDASMTSKGFRATHSAVCGGTLTASSVPQRLVSHLNYGSEEYKDSISCDWIIVSVGNRPINIKFLRFRTEDCYDYLTIVGRISPSRTSLKFCGFQVPKPIFAAAPYVTLRFQTDDSTTYSGFEAEYFTS